MGLYSKRVMNILRLKKKKEKRKKRESDEHTGISYNPQNI